MSIGAQGALPDSRVPAIRGEMSVEEALRRVLAGTGLAARQVGPSAWRIERAVAPPPVAAADDPPPPPAIDPVPIIVTATKQPLELIDVPGAVSVVLVREHRRRDPGANSATVAGEQEGLALTSLGPGRNRMFLRGVADSAFSGQSQSTVAVVLDEARLTYAAPDPDIRLVDIDRVEVLKGPQGALYGTGALGGIYRLVTHPAQLDQTTLDATALSTAIAGGGLGYGVSSVGNLPLIKDAAALRLAGYLERSPGWVDTGSRQDSDRTHVTGLRALFGLEPRPDWRIDLTAFGQWLEAGDSRYVYRRHARTRPVQLVEPHDNDLRHLALRAEGKIGGASAMLATAMTWHDVDDAYDATVGAEAFGLADPRLLLDSRAYRTWDSELRLRGSAGRLGWLVGLSHVTARQVLVDDLTSFGGTRLRVANDRREASDTAFYFDLTHPIAHRLTIDAGARVFYASLHENRVLDAVDFDRRRHRFGVTPSIALSWQPDPAQSVYVRYGSAFRQGGSTVTSSNRVQSLEGDELATIEGGWRRRLRGEGLIDVSVWYSWWMDIQSDELQANGLLNTVNAGDGRIAGASASATLPMARGWRLDGGFDVTRAVLTRNALGFQVNDRRLPAVPLYTFRAALRKDVRLLGASGWAQLGARYLGPSRMSFDPDLDRKMGKVFDLSFDAHATLGRLGVELSTSNLLNQRANVFAFGNPLRYRTMDQYTPQQPRTVKIGLTLPL